MSEHPLQLDVRRHPSAAGHLPLGDYVDNEGMGLLWAIIGSEMKNKCITFSQKINKEIRYKLKKRLHTSITMIALWSVLYQMHIFLCLLTN